MLNKKVRVCDQFFIWYIELHITQKSLQINHNVEFYSYNITDLDP